MCHRISKYFYYVMWHSWKQTSNNTSENFYGGAEMLISVETLILCTEMSVPHISVHVTYHTGALAAFYSSELYHTIRV
jgi:hypothetical protein